MASVPAPVLPVDVGSAQVPCPEHPFGQAEYAYVTQGRNIAARRREESQRCLIATVVNRRVWRGRSWGKGKESGPLLL